MWHISAPALVKTASSPTSTHHPRSQYDSGLDPYYGAYFAAKDEEAAQLTALKEKFEIHRHSDGSQESEYSQYSAHSHQHRFSMPPVAHIRDKDRERDLKRHSDYSFDYDPHHMEGVERPWHDVQYVHHESMMNLPQRR